jgi:MFS family permease
VLPHGLGLALGSAGFGSIATFVTLYYAARHWPNAALSLTVFGTLFIGARLLFANMIKTYGGFRVAIVSFAFESSGLLLLWLAPVPHVALVGAALTGFGFALIFPALGVEAVALVPPASRGAALSAYSVFLDLSLGITGPLAGYIAGAFGYPQVFLFAAAAAAAGVALSMVLYQRQARVAGGGGAVRRAAVELAGGQLARRPATSRRGWANGGSRVGLLGFWAFGLWAFGLSGSRALGLSGSRALGSRALGLSGSRALGLSGSRAIRLYGSRANGPSGRHRAGGPTGQQADPISMPSNHLPPTARTSPQPASRGAPFIQRSRHAVRRNSRRVRSNATKLPATTSSSPTTASGDH